MQFNPMHVYLVVKTYSIHWDLFPLQPATLMVFLFLMEDDGRSGGRLSYRGRLGICSFWKWLFFCPWKDSLGLKLPQKVKKSLLKGNWKLCYFASLGYSEAWTGSRQTCTASLVSESHLEGTIPLWRAQVELSQIHTSITHRKIDSTFISNPKLLKRILQ